MPTETEAPMLKFRLMIGSHCQGFPIEGGEEPGPFGPLHRRMVMYRAGDIIECTEDLVKIYCKPGVTAKFEKLHPESTPHLKDRRKFADPNMPYDISDPGEVKAESVDQQKIANLIQENSDLRRGQAAQARETNELKSQFSQLMELLKAKNEAAETKAEPTKTEPPKVVKK